MDSVGEINEKITALFPSELVHLIDSLKLKHPLFEFCAALCGEAADAVGAANYSIIKTSPAQQKNSWQAS